MHFTFIIIFLILIRGHALIDFRERGGRGERGGRNINVRDPCLPLKGSVLA